MSNPYNTINWGLLGSPEILKNMATLIEGEKAKIVGYIIRYKVLAREYELDEYNLLTKEYYEAMKNTAEEISAECQDRGLEVSPNDMLAWNLKEMMYNQEIESFEEFSERDINVTHDFWSGAGTIIEDCYAIPLNQKEYDIIRKFLWVW